MDYCDECGEHVGSHNNFCVNCGNGLRDDIIGRPAAPPWWRRRPVGIAAGVVALLVVVGMATEPGGQAENVAATAAPVRPRAPRPTTTEYIRPTTTAAEATTTTTTVFVPPPTSTPPPTVAQRVAPPPMQAPSNGCHPEYEGACVPIASDVDCAGGSGNGPEYVEGPFRSTGSDPYGLDHDKDGIACES